MKGQNWSTVARLRRLSLLCGEDGGPASLSKNLNEVRRKANPHLRLRPAFVAGSAANKPLLARLISSRGLALQLYLIAKYECQVTRPTGAPHRNTRKIRPRDRSVGWVDLLAIPLMEGKRKGATPNENRVRQVKSAIARLAAETAVRLPLSGNVRDRFEDFELLDEDLLTDWRTQPPYRVPRQKEGFSVPAEFFENGWIYCLTDSEIAMWLVLRLLKHEHPDSHTGPGVFMPDRLRQERFGLTRDAYEAHAALAEFGLIEGVGNADRYQSNRSAAARRLKQTEPLRFVLIDKGLDENAFCAVPRVLLASLRDARRTAPDTDDLAGFDNLIRAIPWAANHGHAPFCPMRRRWG